MTIADWPVSYDELEPLYDRFDKLCGVSGQAGNVRGQSRGRQPVRGAAQRISQQAREILACRQIFDARPRKASAITRSRPRGDLERPY